MKKPPKNPLGLIFLKPGFFPTLFQGGAVCGVSEAHCERAQECCGQVSLSTERLSGRGGTSFRGLTRLNKMQNCSRSAKKGTGANTPSFWPITFFDLKNFFLNLLLFRLSSIHQSAWKLAQVLFILNRSGTVSSVCATNF
jgi:hypothetical protein